MPDSATDESLPYAEPTIVPLLILSSFLLLLNLVNYILDSSVYCGLIGQLVIGVFWGTPLSGLLSITLQRAVVQLGYLGLILLVYEGGLNTNISLVLKNLWLSICVAATGILLPIALSFLLGPLVGADKLQCFSAGAALSATSLGTTFTILSTAGFEKTRLGTVLTSAAMMDDVVGLVMIQIVSELGQSSSSISGGSIGRPVGASIGLLSLVVASCWVFQKLIPKFKSKNQSKTNLDIMGKVGVAESKFVIHTGFLVMLVVVASYAGATPLLAAFLAGVGVSWWDFVSLGPANAPSSGQNAEGLAGAEENKKTWSGREVYEHYYSRIVNGFLKPFFFASVGFSIPIRQMFHASTVWRGVVYALLMTLGKLCTGLWLVRFNVAPVWGILQRMGKFLKKRTIVETCVSQPEVRTSTIERDTTSEQEGDKQEGPREPSTATTKASPPPAAPHPPSSTSKPRSLYPATILGLSMVARGEVAFLIAAIANEKGILGGDGISEELYLIVMWAAVVCTVIGPLGVGLLVRRVKNLERKRVAEGGSSGTTSSVLGVWGVEVG